MFNLEIPISSYILLGIEIILGLLLLLFLSRPLRLIKRLPLNPYEEMNERKNVISEESDTEEQPEIAEPGQSDITGAELSSSMETEKKYPKVSVVVYSTVNEEVLTEFLRQITSQDYPDFEVIVVCDATQETSSMLSEKFAAIFPNVYITFIPPGSHNLSRRKLALTLGIKAASGEIIVTTVANAVIPSTQWLTALTLPLVHNNLREVSLGYSHPDFSELPSSGRLYKEFFRTLTDANWIGYALLGKPYRGDGFNLAFRRELFFRCKGYSKTMHLHTGEDDLFIHDVADRYNTAVVISPETILTTIWGPTASSNLNLQRSQYDFTSRWLPSAPFARAGAASASQWLIIFLGLASALAALPNIIPSIAAAIVWIIVISLEAWYYHRAANKLQTAPLSWQVPLFWLIKPLNNMLFRGRRRGARYKNYTWQRQKLS